MSDAELYRRFRELKPVKIAVIGDLILDEYLTGDISRISPEAPVGVLDCHVEELKLGGAANVAANLKKLGCAVSLIGVTGKDTEAACLKAILKREGINHTGIIASADRPTIKKTRVIAQHQQLIRIDREKRKPVTAETEEGVAAAVRKILPSVEGLILSDYNKGLLTKGLLKEIIQLAVKEGKPVIVDPKGDSFAKYHGADIITPNRNELEKATGMRCDSDRNVEKAARSLIKRHSLKGVLATLGADGMALFLKDGSGRFFGTMAKEVYDVTGAGDTVVATFTAGLLGGLLPDEAAKLSNYAGGLQVAHLGAVSISRQEIEMTLAGDAGFTESKIVDVKTAAETAALLKKRKKKVVFTNGCFDLIHFGHIQYLQKARKQGDRLIVGLNSDSSVKKLKGPGRPLLNEHDRAHILAALDCVDQVVLFSEQTPLKLIKSIKPDVLVKGGDYQVHQIVGHREVEKWGGEVKTIQYIEGNSTSGIIQKIIRNESSKR